MHDLRVLAHGAQGATNQYLIERAPGWQLVRRVTDDYYIFLPWSYYWYSEFNGTGIIVYVTCSQKRRDSPDDPHLQLPIPTVNHWSGAPCVRHVAGRTFGERLGFAFDHLYTGTGSPAMDSHFHSQFIPRLLVSMNLPADCTSHVRLLQTWEESSPGRVRRFDFDPLSLMSYLPRWPTMTYNYTRIPIDKFVP